MSWEEIDRKYPNVRKDWKEVYFYPINIPKQEDFWDFQRRIKMRLEGQNAGFAHLVAKKML